MSGRVRAAGRTLTLGELREALAGLDDNTPVRIDWTGDYAREPVPVLAADGATLDLGPAPDTDRAPCAACGCDGQCGYQVGYDDGVSDAEDARCQAAKAAAFAASTS